MKIDLNQEIELPQGVTAEQSNSLLTLKGVKGEVKRDFKHPKVKITVEGNKLILVANQGTKREKAVLGSYASHLKNMIQGVQEHHVYKLKICSGHFPMNVSVSGKELIIKNFLGESVPRKVQLMDGATVKVNGTEIVVSGPSKELAGQMAAKIENLCRITNRDTRIFQDGCYMIHKSGKDLA